MSEASLLSADFLTFRIMTLVFTQKSQNSYFYNVYVKVSACVCEARNLMAAIRQRMLGIY